nr:hypothetical protein [Ornithinibacter aureus]
MATYTGRFPTLPSRTLSTIASINTTGHTASSGRDCHAFWSRPTCSVTADTSDFDTCVS